MKKKLYVGYNEREDVLKTRDFEMVGSVPEVGDCWGRTGEVVKVEEVHLDIENSTAFPEEYKAYKVSWIELAEDKDDPFVDYIAIVVQCEGVQKGYVKDFFGNDTEMQSWIFDNGIEVYEKDFDNDLHCFAVYNGEANLGTIYPDNIDDMKSCMESLNAGEDPISGHWEDGCGNLCTLEGWGESEDDME